VHTLSHAALPFLPDDELVRQIVGCHAELQARFPGILPYLAIPFGLFDARTIRLSAQAGMTASLTLAGETLGRQSRRSRPDAGLPRFCVVREHTAGIVALKLSRVATVVNRLRVRRTNTFPALPSPTT
jgi:peptidoglycan/xylan/chitin deacetylase (PgdA/CDA1 family)